MRLDDIADMSLGVNIQTVVTDRKLTCNTAASSGVCMLSTVPVPKRDAKPCQFPVDNINALHAQ